ncbi:hypothetical protein [Leifsonia sp. LS-T14]|uniref:hypothetical protein n=1 Tax=unclassified Leifsonia TaxID=2663824 RepID=UPI0035A65FC3
MLLDEYVDFRVRTGESERLRVEREQARRVREHGRWLQSLLRRGTAEAAATATDTARASAPVEAGAPAALPIATPAEKGAPEPVEVPERQLARAGH